MTRNEYYAEAKAKYHNAVLDVLNNQPELSYAKVGVLFGVTDIAIQNIATAHGITRFTGHKTPARLAAHAAKVAAAQVQE